MGIFNNCKDPALKALKSKGYNVVQVPRSDLFPTQLLVNRNNRLQRLGELTSVFVPNPDGPPIPPIKPDRIGPNISGEKSNQLDVGIGLNILGGLISALGGSTLGVNVAFARAATVQFEYDSTLENSSEVALIDQFLAGSTVNHYARAATEMLENDLVYVVTGTLKSKKINVSAKDSNKQSIGIDIPTIQNAIGGNVKASSGAAGSSVVSFEGVIPLVFGFQAVRLIFDQGHYRTMKLIDAGDVVAESAADIPEDLRDYVVLDADRMLAR